MRILLYREDFHFQTVFVYLPHFLFIFRQKTKRKEARIKPKTNIDTLLPFVFSFSKMFEDKSSSERSLDIFNIHRSILHFNLNIIFSLSFPIGSGRRSRVNNEEPKQQGKPTSMANNNNGNGKAKSIEK